MTLVTTNPFDLSKDDFLNRDLLREQLKKFIKGLLEDDFEHLCALMYRHDVHEEEFNKALALANDDDRALKIAELVIDRELQKMETRAAYARHKTKTKLNR